MEAAHAKFAPSAASRWIVCNDSVNYPDDEPKNEFTRQSAEWGSQVHEWLSTPRPAAVPSNWTPEQVIDARECAAEWSKHVPDDAKKEVKLFSKRWPALFFGTIDALWIDPADCVNIADLKTGLSGVNVANNPQLLCYALLASEHYPAAKTFRTMIVQPRRQYFGQHVYTIEQVESFGRRVRLAIESAPRRVAGTHCEFCPALLHCDVSHNSLFQVLKDAETAGLWTPKLIPDLNNC